MMRKVPWAVYCWPGLPQIWSRGSWSALVVAVAAAGALNLALLASFGWVEVVSANVRNLLWAAIGGAWAVAVILSILIERAQGSLPRLEGACDGFRQAEDHYLKGNWFEAERILARVLRADARDVDARLMLATLLRHTGRREEAGEQLDVLVRLDGSEKWDWEIQRERELLTEAP